MKPLLDLTDVNYTYQTAEGETPAVKNLSFRVFPAICFKKIICLTG